jgi:hypothetical protein
MKITLIEFDGTAEELDSSIRVGELLDRRSDVRRGRIGPTVPAEAVDDDDAGVGGSAMDTRPPAAPVAPDGVPGVAAEGQESVRRLLKSNPAGELFVEFLAATTSWPSVGAHGIKRKGARAGDPLDYSRYLRLRKQGSQFGGFAYVYALEGTVNLRLSFDSDEELAAIASEAWRVHSGHRKYRVNIRINDERTLKQAVALARLAYDAT